MNAEQYILMANEEKTLAQNFLNLYQDVSDFIFPRESQITTLRTEGDTVGEKIYDPTALLDARDMASGFIGMWIPAGKLFFGLKTKNRAINELDEVKRYLSLATQIAHDEIFESNFLVELQESILSDVIFGIANIKSEWDKDRWCLNYRDWDIANYTIRESARGIVDSVIIDYYLTARQAVEEFGDKAGEKVLKAMETVKTQNQKFPFFHIVQPRRKRNAGLKDQMNMPFESVYINVDEKLIVDEGGYDENPYHVSRWAKTSCEKYGRGIGTDILSIVKELQTNSKSLTDCANRWNNPPREVLDSFDGAVDNRPNALNYVQQIPSIKALDQTALGSFPITKDILEFKQEIIHRAFFRDIFVQLGALKGDRRTTVEIMERVKESLRRLVSPISRLEAELFTPLITRSVLLLIRNGVIPYPPDSLQGQGLGVEYVGELAMALKDYQARAFNQFASLLVGLDQVFPGAKDVISIERALPDIAISYGVKAEHLATPEEMAAKQKQRQQEMAAMQAMQAAQVGAEGYQKTSKTAEEGSPAAQLQEAIGV
jgi:hypothetical protein